LSSVANIKRFDIRRTGYQNAAINFILGGDVQLLLQLADGNVSEAGRS